jgi:hypothetical protein
MYRYVVSKKADLVAVRVSWSSWCGIPRSVSGSLSTGEWRCGMKGPRPLHPGRPPCPSFVEPAVDSASFVWNPR